MTIIILALIAGVLGFAMTLSFIGAVASFIVVGALAWFGLPTLAWGFYGLPFLFAAAVAVSMAVNAVLTSLDDKRANSALSWSVWGVGAAVAVIWLGVIPLVTTAPMFHAQAYHDLIGPVPVGQFQEDVEEIDQSKIAIVDADLAERRAQELLGSDPTLGSSVDFGPFVRQMVAGKLVWVAALEHAGAMKALTNDSTPGYVVVNATDARDAKLVTELNGKPIALRCLPSGVFSSNLDRLLYSEYPGVGVTDETFELDNSGKPYFAVTTYEPKVGFSGDKATGIILVDPQSCTMQRFSMNDIPSWIQRVIPEDFVQDQVEDWGAYVHGYFNWAGTDVTHIAPDGIAFLQDNSGRSSFYAGMQSASSQNGTIGYVLVDSRTGKARLHRLVGVTEDGARNAIQGVAQNYHYSSTLPIPYNLHGTPTYISTLKDSAGNMQGIGMAAVQSRSIVAWGRDLREAIRSYNDVLSNQGNAVAVQGQAKILTFAGKVARFGSENLADGTTFYIVLDNAPNRLFSGTAKLSPKLPVARVGDRAQITAADTSNDVIPMQSFDDMDLNFHRTTRQETLTKDAVQVEQQPHIDNEARQATEEFQKLSPERKAALMKILNGGQKTPSP